MEGALVRGRGKPSRKWEDLSLMISNIVGEGGDQSMGDCVRVVVWGNRPRLLAK